MKEQMASRGITLLFL